MASTMRSLVIATLFGAACSGTSSDQPDAASPADADLHGCDVIAPQQGTPDVAAPTMYTGKHLRLCGTLEVGIADAAGNNSVDEFPIHVDQATDVIVRFDASSPVTAYSRFELGFETLNGLSPWANVWDTHGVIVVHLQPGQDNIIAVAGGGAPITTGTNPFVVSIDPLDVNALCAATGQLNYHESHDGIDSTGNDTIAQAAVGGGFDLTPSTTDAPEQSSLQIYPNQPVQLQGEIGTETDMDTYVIQMASGVGEVAVRFEGPPQEIQAAFVEPDLSRYQYIGPEGSFASSQSLSMVTPPKTGGDVWLWVSHTWDQSAGFYTIMLCGLGAPPPP
jgi:hypothetical protein